MLEQEKWKDRIEVSLDNRQIFLLFSASAVLLSLVFALGIVAGRRLSPAVVAAPKTDPLALLDQMDEPKDEKTHQTLSFPKTLAKAPARAPGQLPEKATAAPGEKPKPEVVAAAPKEAKLVKAPKAVAVAAKAKKKIASPPKAPTAPPPAAPKAVARASKQKETKATKATPDDNDGAGFTLQLSSFQDKHEAEQYIQSLRAKGHAPQVMPTKIPGRGLWYRVRVGHFKSWKAALEAKGRFERDHQLIAYVARR